MQTARHYLCCIQLWVYSWVFEFVQGQREGWPRVSMVAPSFWVIDVTPLKMKLDVQWPLNFLKIFPMVFIYFVTIFRKYSITSLTSISYTNTWGCVRAFEREKLTLSCLLKICQVPSPKVMPPGTKSSNFDHLDPFCFSDTNHKNNNDMSHKITNPTYTKINGQLAPFSKTQTREAEERREGHTLRLRRGCWRRRFGDGGGRAREGRM